MSLSLIPYSAIYCVSTDSDVTASAIISALESSLCMSSFLRRSSRVGQGLAGVNQTEEDILTACINKTLNRK